MFFSERREFLIPKSSETRHFFFHDARSVYLGHYYIQDLLSGVVSFIFLQKYHFFSLRPTIMEIFLAIISGDYFCSFEAPAITASEIRGVHYGF